MAALTPAATRRNIGALGDEDAIADAPFRLALEAAPTGMVLIGRDGRIVLVNAEAERLFGYAPGELVGRPLELLIPARFHANHPRFREAFFAAPATRPMGAGRDLHGVRRDGTEVPLEIGLNPLVLGEREYVLSSVVDITERRRAVEQFRLAIEAAPTGMIMIDAGGRIVLVNVQVEKLFGYTRDELYGMPVEVLVPARLRERHPGFRAAFVAQPVARPMGAGRDLFGVRKDGVEVPIEIGLNPMETPDGRFVLSSVVDITERKRAEQQLGATLREREVLLQEVHHRVKNNLQVISSLLNMQVRRLDEGASREALAECQNRVQAIALIHEQLYRTRDYARVPFADYARSLAELVFATAGVAADWVALELDIEHMTFTVDRAIPCGLILNELISNALKHAFPGGRRGTIRVAMRAFAGEVELTVADDGCGISAEVDVERSDSLGLQLVTTLAEQLDGRIAVVRAPGTRFEVRFPVEASP